LARQRPGQRLSGTSRPRSAPTTARKRFGQHFLEPAWVAKLVDALNPAPDDTFLEIGPGRGALTHALAPRVKRIVAVEIDRDLVELLTSSAASNVRIVGGDFLDVDVNALLHDTPQPVRVVGNLPYNVATPILFKLLDAANEGRRFEDATLMLQKEVAERIVAQPGTAGYGTLAVQVALLAGIDRLFVLPPGAFRPPPKVTSAVVRLRFHAPIADVGDRAVFERVVRGMFLQRRKTLLNAFRPVAVSFGRSAGQVIDSVGLDPSKRPGMLTLQEIASLSRAVL
jgi:16S rRNA (adenine1518-N6/adenine1519-N6)-dimethyltransferase